MTFKDIFDDLYSKIRLMPSGEYSINKLSKMSGHHFNSIRDYISIIDQVQKNYFKISIIMKNEKYFVNIQNFLLENIQISEENEFLIKLYLFEAFSAKTSIQLIVPNLVKSNLLKNGIIKKENLKFYLSKKGITKSLYLLQTIDEIDFESILENKNHPIHQINTSEELIEFQYIEAEIKLDSIYPVLS